MCIVGDWEMVLAHHNKAFNSGLKADNGIEYIGLVDAYAYLENWELALEISRDVALSHVKNIPLLCALWEQLAVSNDLNSPTDIFSRISQFAECQKE